MSFPGKFSTGFFVALIAFSIGIAFTVFWIFSREIYQLPPLNREKLEISEQEELPEIKRQREFMKERVDELPKFKHKHILKPFEEKPLSAFSNSIDENYRFFWIPSFHPAVSVRVWKEGKKKILVAKIAAGTGFNFKKSTIKVTKTLSEEEWKDFLDAIDHSKFWSKPIFDMEDEPVRDGAFYLYEGKKANNIHEIHRLTPDQELWKLGNFLINLAEIKTEYDNY